MSLTRKLPMIKHLVIVCIILIFIYACKHTVDIPVVAKPTDTTTTGSGTGTGTGGSSLVCFESQILPIFTSNCAKSGCHAVGSSQDGYTLDSYNGIRFSNNKGIKPGDPNDSEIYEAITENDVNKRMPLGEPALSAAQVALIKQWILEGAQNTTNCGTYL